MKCCRVCVCVRVHSPFGFDRVLSVCLNVCEWCGVLVVVCVGGVRPFVEVFLSLAVLHPRVAPPCCLCLFVRGRTTQFHRKVRRRCKVGSVARTDSFGGLIVE